MTFFSVFFRFSRRAESGSVPFGKLADCEIILKNIFVFGPGYFYGIDPSRQNF